jgi:hypothetical protein
MSTRKPLKASQPLNPAIVRALDQLAVAAANVEKALGDETRVLTSADKKRIVKLRNGGERVVRHIFELAKRYKLDVPHLQSDEMLAHLARFESLTPAETVLAPLAARVADVRFLAGSDAWTIALGFYAILTRLALTDRTVAEAVAPVEEFFARKSDAASAAKPTKLQTRANQKLAHAEKLATGANVRASARTAEQPSPPPAAPKVVVVSNGATNGALNGAANGALNGAGSLNGA